MFRTSRYLSVLFLLLAFLSNALPCGPGWVAPLFDVVKAPEEPYTEFAAGKLGIVKPTFGRAVLYAAYRYANGSPLSAEEQQALREVWKADFQNRDFRDTDVSGAIKAWIAKRKEVVGDEKTQPAIYSERQYEGYQFFPNCAQNAFEVATETLSDRASAHGPQDPGVVDWIKAQDAVFTNCAAGKRTPADPPAGAPEWLQKDRAYQKAAAEFYSLDYDAARRDFQAIAEDSASPWQETAAYLVARTLVRQASLSKAPARSREYYEQAEANLTSSAASGGKFSDASDRLLDLVKFKIHPKERALELAHILSGFGSTSDFRQNVIDYTWLLDRFENDALEAQVKKQELADAKPLTAADLALEQSLRVLVNGMVEGVDVSISSEHVVRLNGTVPFATKDDIERAIKGRTNYQISDYLVEEMPSDGRVVVPLYFAGADGSLPRLLLAPDSTDQQILAAAEKAAGKPLTAEQRTEVLSQWQNAYTGRFSGVGSEDSDSQYVGDGDVTPEMLPGFLGTDPLTEWLFVYQMKPADSYALSLERYRSVRSPVWLMAAISKAQKDSPGVNELLEAVDRFDRNSPAFTTVSYYAAKLDLDLGKQDAARKLISENLSLGDELPRSAGNLFRKLDLRVAVTMDEYLASSFRRAYAFDFDGESGTLDDIIAEQKTWYDPENSKQTREEYNKEIEDNFATELAWQNKEMFDSETVEVFNRTLSTQKMLDVSHSKLMPDELRRQFILAIWTRSFLLGDAQTLTRVTPDAAAVAPELSEYFAAVQAAKTPVSRDYAALYLVLKNPILSPYLQSGFGTTDNTQGEWDADDWWCLPYEDEGKIYDDRGNEIAPLPVPPFLSAAEAKTGAAEHARLKQIGDAPKYLADRVLDWAKKYPADKHIPEALYIVIHANAWTKYGCGSNTELHDQLAAYLRARYPRSEWTAKLDAEDKENESN